MRDEEHYQKLGFKCGLEIHQRLATSEKLFCSCNAMLQEDQKLMQISRYQRAVAGELGNVDLSAKFESGKHRQFIYNTFKHTTCLVDVDEEPPHKLNPEAFDIALLVCAALNAKVPDEVQPMRKEVVDGSDPSAFQRTLMMGYSGKILVGKKEIPITSVFLEEESSGIEKGDTNQVTYNVDRLGIPLVEIDTAPVIKTPEEAKLVAMQIGLLLRLTGKVQRGIGSIRQDVNVSIKDGARVELKGFQELDVMDAIIDNEIMRQEKLIHIRNELRSRNAKVGNPKDITSIFSETKVKVIKDNLNDNGAVYGMKLVGFKDLIGYEINENRRLGSEISDYAKIAGVRGIMHSDENLEQYGFGANEVGQIRKALDMGQQDAFVIVSGKKDVCERAMELAKMRAEMSIERIPNETRAVDNKQLITRFLRPLPGGARMYPETDASPIQVNVGHYSSLLKKRLDPEAIRNELVQEIGNKQLAEQMLWSKDLTLYKKIIKETGVKGSVVAPVLLEKFKDLRRRGINVDALKEEIIIYIFKKYASGGITKSGIEELAKMLPKMPTEVDMLIDGKGLTRIRGKRLEMLVKSEAVGKNKKELFSHIMTKYRLNVDGDELSQLLKDW